MTAWRLAGTLVALACVSVACSRPPAEPPPSTPMAIEGMWSDPPETIIGSFCVSWCTDAGIEHLNALLDDPANDERPFPQLRTEAQKYQRDQYLRPRLTEAALATYPLDPADDPGLLNCEPWGLARQMFARHQLEIRQIGPDRLELRYGEWDARRTVYLDGRARPAGEPPSRLGHSIGRWEGDTLVVETSGVAANQTSWDAKHSDQLRTVERFTPAEDGQSLQLTATVEDPWSLSEPVVIKRIWRWAPEAEIAPYEDCELPTEVRRGTGQE